MRWEVSTREQKKWKERMHAKYWKMSFYALSIQVMHLPIIAQRSISILLYRIIYPYIIGGSLLKTIKPDKPSATFYCLCPVDLCRINVIWLKVGPANTDPTLDTPFETPAILDPGVLVGKGSPPLISPSPTHQDWTRTRLIPFDSNLPWG